MSGLSVVHRVQRATLALHALYAGVLSLCTLFVPRVVAREIVGGALTGTSLVYSQLWAGARLSLALVALVAAFAARPPRSLVWAIAIGLIGGFVGLGFVGATATVPWPDLKPFRKWLAPDAFVAGLLVVTGLVRARLRRRRAV